MAGKTRVIILIVLLHFGINFYKAELSHYDACRRVLLHSDFRRPCGKLVAPNKRPCMVSTAADRQYLKDAKIHYLYQPPDVKGPMICAPRWNNTKSAECISAPKEPDDSLGWTWSDWTPSSGRMSRRVTLTGYDTIVLCIYVETMKVKDCVTAKAAGISSGVTFISPDKTIMKVYCDQDTDGGGWIVFQKRISASDFYLYWADYVAGFGDPATNYWLGLENIHLLTSLSHTQLKVVLEYPAWTFAVADYSSFEIQDSGTDYTLQLSGYSSTSTPHAGNSLGYHNGRVFSTRDRNSNCAVSFRGAWWYGACHTSNLNGLYGSTTYGRGIIWNARTGIYDSLHSCKMMIR